MSKFSKRSIAVLTTAAIMASSMSIVAFAEQTAAYTLTNTSGLTVKYSNLKVEDATQIASAWGTLKTETSGQDGFSTAYYNNVYALNETDAEIVAVFDGKEVTVAAGAYAYVGEMTGDTTLAKKPAGGSTSEPTPAGKENTDKVVWVNGKDTKANTKVTPATPASLYKTEQFDQAMMSVGGKWQVAVTDTTIATADDFVALFKDGKYTPDAKAKAAEWKQLASAKVKEGTVTVTAGKKAGVVNVWVYEVKAKQVVNAKIGEGESAVEVKPQMTVFTVKVAPKLAVTSAATTVDAATNVVKGVDNTAKFSGDYAPGDVVYAYLVTKKADTSLGATYEIVAESTDKCAAEVAANDGNGSGPAVKITIDSTAAVGDTVKVSVKNIESGKVAKISFKVNKEAASNDKTEEVTLTVGTGVKVLVDGTEKTLTDSKVTLAKGTKVTFDVDVTIGDKDVTAGTEYEVTADATVAAKAA